MKLEDELDANAPLSEGRHFSHYALLPLLI